MAEKKILLGLTTTPASDWREKIREIYKFGIKEIALFLTGIGSDYRRELYSLLEKTRLKSIPHVHLRDDMNLEEIKYLEHKYNVKVFNVHNEKDPHPHLKAKDCLDAYRLKIFVENTDDIPADEELKNFGGICIDFSHWQDGIILKRPDYDRKMKDATKQFCIGCGHISAVGNTLIKSNDIQLKEVAYENFSKHHLDILSELDYIKKFKEFIPDIVSIELTNSFEEQLKVKKYLEKIINS